jgi:hypothetical protein
MTIEEVSFRDFVRLVLDALVAADVGYLIGGSVALWAWGDPRSTRDFDLVIDLPFEQVYALSRELERRRMLVPPDIILDLLLQQEGDLPINALHLDSNYKAELFLLRPGDLFRANALARRELVDLGPPLGEVYVHAPEDLIINKIHYYSLSSQTKHLRDIASVLAMSPDLIDFDYLAQWIEAFNLTAIWEEMQQQIAKLVDGES